MVDANQMGMFMNVQESHLGGSFVQGAAADFAQSERQQLTNQLGNHLDLNTNLEPND